MSSVYINPVISRNKLSNRRPSGIHKHSEHELYYMLKGRTTYFIGDEICDIDEGNFVFIAKDIYHKTDNENCPNNERILVSLKDEIFTGKALPLLNELQNSSVMAVPISKLPILEELLYKIEEEFSKRIKNSNILIDSYITELLALLCRYKFDYTPQVTDSGRIIHMISDYISENYNHDITLDMLSKHFSLSRAYISRKFKVVTGIGINEYVTFVRINNAERLLKTTHMSITEVAYACGYNDSNYFSTVFKHIHKMTPLKFSKQYHN